MRKGHELNGRELAKYMRDNLGLNTESVQMREFGHGQVRARMRISVQETRATPGTCMPFVQHAPK